MSFSVSVVATPSYNHKHFYFEQSKHFMMIHLTLFKLKCLEVLIYKTQEACVLQLTSVEHC